MPIYPNIFSGINQGLAGLQQTFGNLAQLKMQQQGQDRQNASLDLQNKMYQMKLGEYERQQKVMQDISIELGNLPPLPEGADPIEQTLFESKRQRLIAGVYAKNGLHQEANTAFKAATDVDNHLMTQAVNIGKVDPKAGTVLMKKLTGLDLDIKKPLDFKGAYGEAVENRLKAEAAGMMEEAEGFKKDAELQLQSRVKEKEPTPTMYEDIPGPKNTVQKMKWNPKTKKHDIPVGPPSPRWKPTESSGDYAKTMLLAAKAAGVDPDKVIKGNITQEEAEAIIKKMAPMNIWSMMMGGAQPTVKFDEKGNPIK